MSASIIAFPTPLERDEAEFDRQGTSNYTRAFAEAAILWDVARCHPDRAGLGNRIEAFAGMLGYLSRYRPESLDDMVILSEGNRIKLRLVPDELRSMLGAERA